MANPIVTAIIPVHNHATWVNDAVRSVVTQDYDPLSLVVVDDGSTDGSHEQVLSCLESLKEGKVEGEDARAWSGTIRGISTIVLRFGEAGGPSLARNRGFKVAQQVFAPGIVAFLDSDDMYMPGKISKSVTRFQESSAVGVVYSDFDTLRPDGLRLRQYKEPFSRRRLLEECIVNCDSLVLADAFGKAGGFDPDLRVCEDYDLWLRISEKYLLNHVPESLVTIRVGEHSSTSQIQSETWKRCYTRVFEKAKERAGG